MVSISSQHIEELNSESLSGSTSITIENSIIDHIDFCSLSFSKEVVIRDCVIQKMELLGTFFEKGLRFENNVIIGDVTFEAGGHNATPISFSGNVFHGLFHVFDCVFDAPLIVRDNIFIKSTDLLTKEDKGFDNSFEGGLSNENNLGTLNIW